MSAAPETVPQPMETEKCLAENAPPQNAEKDKENGMPANENKEDSSRKEMKAAKVILRLDDGTVAKFKDDTKAVELLDPQAAWKAGALKEEHLLRIQSLLCEVHAKLPDEGPLKSVSLLSSKRSIDTVLDVGQINSAKKTKTMFGNNVSTPINSPGVVTSRQKDFPSVARRLVKFLTKTILKKDAYLFMDPVDDSVEAVKDYYDIVPHGPISFNMITDKIEKNEYTSPREFFDDVFKICDNCYQYNIVAHPTSFGWNLGILAAKMEQSFMQAWSTTAFASFADPERQPREIPKKNPNAAPKPAKPARSSSMNRQPKSFAPKVYMTPEMENDLVTALNTAAILEANMEAVVEILTVANEMGTDEDGEPSLDLEKVSAPTKRKLYDLVVKKPTGSGGSRPATSGFQMEDDDDYECDD